MVSFSPFLPSQKNIHLYKCSLQRSSIESRGLTTVVLPAPMIICFTPLSPPSTVRWKSEIMATCLSCSILLSENLPAGNQKPALLNRLRVSQQSPFKVSFHSSKASPKDTFPLLFPEFATDQSQVPIRVSHYHHHLS